MSELAELKKQAEHILARISTLENQPPKKWKRKGDWILWASGDFDKIHAYHDFFSREVNQGRTYQTQEAAESVKPYDAFYGLLCGLACELNPSGKVGGANKVEFSYDMWRPSITEGFFATDHLFETYEAAEKAAKILNCDGIKPPQVGGVK